MSEGGPEETSGRTHLARNTAVMAAGTTLSRVTGFLRIASLAFAFGVTESKLADAYNIANVAPNIVYELVLGGVLSSVLVPIFVETLRREDGESRHVVNTVTTLAMSLLVVVTVATVVMAPFIARLLTLRVEGGPAEVAAVRSTVTLFLRLFMPEVLFYGLTAIWTAYLNANRHFAAPMFSPALNNIVVSGIALTFGAMVGFEAVDLAAVSTGKLLLVGIGTSLGIVAMTLPLWPVARRHGWSWRPTFDWRHPVVRRVARLGGWVMLYVAINQIGYFVVVVLTGAIGQNGAFTAYTYAFVFFQLPHGIYAVSVMTALLPSMSEAASDRDLDAFRDHLTRGVRVTSLLILPAAVGMGVLAAPIVRLLLEHGVFSASSTDLLARTLTAFVIGMTSFSLFQLFLRAFYALQNTRTPTLVNAAAVGVNIIVDVAAFALLPDRWKVPGLALGHATAYTVGAALLAIRLRSQLGRVDGRRTASQLLRIAAAAAAMGAIVLGLSRAIGGGIGAWPVPDAAALGVLVLVGAGSYLGLAVAFGVEDLSTVAALVRRRRGRR